MRSILLAVALLGSPAAYATDASCAGQFTAQGVPFVGKTFNAKRFFDALPPADALKRALAHTLRDGGWNVASVDRALGVVAAASKTGGKKPMELKIAVEPQAGGGVAVSASYQTFVGQAAAEKDVQAYFCGLMTAIAESATPDDEIFDLHSGVGSAGGAAAASASAGKNAGAMSAAKASGMYQTAEAQTIAALDKAIQYEKLAKAQLSEARPLIEKMLPHAACIHDSNLRQLNAYSDSGTRFCASASTPIPYAMKENKGFCMSVVRIGDIKLQTAESFSFKAVFADDGSKAASTAGFEVKKYQGDWVLNDCALR